MVKRLDRAGKGAWDMLNVAGWTFALYAMLKLCHLVLGPKRGPDREPIALRTRLRAGEPGLLAGTVAVAALLVLYTSWWSHTFLSGHYAYATGCYPRMAAARYLPGVPARLGSYGASEAVGNFRRSAEIHGGKLGLDEAAIDRGLDRSRAVLARRYSAIAAADDRAGIAAALDGVEQCFRGKGRPRGEILHPV